MVKYVGASMPQDTVSPLTFLCLTATFGPCLDSDFNNILKNT